MTWGSLHPSNWNKEGFGGIRDVLGVPQGMTSFFLAQSGSALLLVMAQSVPAEAPAGRSAPTGKEEPAEDVPWHPVLECWEGPRSTEEGREPSINGRNSAEPTHPRPQHEPPGSQKTKEKSLSSGGSLSRRDFFALMPPSSGRNSLTWERLEKRALGSPPSSGCPRWPPCRGCCHCTPSSDSKPRSQPGCDGQNRNSSHGT